MKPEVYINKAGDRKSFTIAVLSKFGDDLEGKKVFIKPNIVSHEYYPTTTHPDILDAVISFLLNKDCAVRVGDAPALDAGSPARILDQHPLNAVCSKYGINLLNLHGMGFKKVKIPIMTLRVSKEAFNADFVISLPVLKIHGICTLTGALKNQFGFFQNRERVLLHARLKNIHEAIAGLNSVIKTDLFIVDAVETLRKTNEVRHGGIPARLGYLLAGTDPVALDCHGFELLKQVEESLAGKTPEDVKHVKKAIEIGVGRKEFQVVEI